MRSPLESTAHQPRLDSRDPSLRMPRLRARRTQVCSGELTREAEYFPDSKAPTRRPADDPQIGPRTQSLFESALTVPA